MPAKPIPVVAANWKSNGTVASTTELCATFSKLSEGKAECILAPSFIHIGLVKELLSGNKRWQLAAQNCTEKAGAFTGEVNADQVKDLGLGWVILGHSERRAMFGESDAVVASKVSAVLAKGLKVIACIGESLEQREAGETEKVVLTQLKAITAAVPKELWSQVVIAYEPVWAIGTGKVATPEQAQEVHAALRKFISSEVSADVGQGVRLLYGGSVNAKNCTDLYGQQDIDGFLVGGASLKPEFLDVIASTQE